MSSTYKIIVNQENSFDINESDLSRFDVAIQSNLKYHVLQDNKPYFVELIKHDFASKKYQIKVNNSVYEVSIENQLDQLIKSMGIQKGRTKIINAIKAPMPGLILEINVKEGQMVQENEPLLILEAMKMENSFLSPREGVIKSIAVKKGEAVEKGQLLIEFE